MASINDLPKLEGLQDFFIGEIYGPVSAALENKGYFGDHSNPLYMKSLDIIGLARQIPDLYNETDDVIEELVNKLYKELADLKAELAAEE